MRLLVLLPTLWIACDGDGDASDGMPCDDAASLCGTVDAPGLPTPVTCTFAASQVSDFAEPPTPDGVWDGSGNAIERAEVDAFPFSWALNDLDFWDG